MSSVPARLRARPPADALEWVASRVRHGRVRRVRRLRGAWATAVHAIDVDAEESRRQFVLRRWVRPEFASEAAGAIAREGAALDLATSTGLAAPAYVDADPDGSHCDVPALLMTRCAGRSRHDAPFLTAHLDEIVRTLAAIHAVEAAPALLPYDPWYRLDARPPEWSREPKAWATAIEALQSFDPPTRTHLLHRDYHAGNLLWARRRVSGVVDWVHACHGCPEVDVAHCARNLTLLCGLHVAREFVDRYRAETGLGAELQAWFDVGAAVDALPFRPDAWRWHDAGRHDLDDAACSVALDEFLIDAVGRL